MVGLVERKVSTIKPTYLNFEEFLMKIGMDNCLRLNLESGIRVFSKHIFGHFWGRFNISPLEHSSAIVKETYMRDITMTNSAHIRMQQCTYTSFQKLQHSCKTTMNLLT
ncbi:hypothetical protein H5410_051410 [Solanum commersonii]|uniref:Uncharacterized protein n=1 Tax=Solanum commersonii TaxID=4109 RepID=A0A9J5WZG4_SOLCO|nr:hypothetical protein H5410_051410 [Solanum commersonii]